MIKNYPYLAGIFLNIILLAGFVDVSFSAETTVEYRDPKGRFTFETPASWGAGQRGTNDGFGDRVAAIQFQKLASEQRKVMGGEAVLTKGRVMLDMQTLGGLYDAIAIEALPPTLQKQVLALLPPPTPSNFCSLLGKSRHLDNNHLKLSHLKPAIQQGLIGLSRTRNINPKVISCTRKGDTFTYHKEAPYQIGAMQARQHLYGAVRFLKGKFSSFQVVRVETQPPDKALLATLTRVVQSFKNLK